MNWTELMREILKSQEARSIVEMLSPIYGEARVGLWLFEVIGQQLDRAAQWAEEFTDQIVPQTATWFLPYWEREYGIAPDSGKTLEERRAALLLSMQTRPPMNPARLALLAQSVTGVSVRIQENISPCVFGIFFDHTGTSSIDLVKLAELVERAKPAHLTVLLRPRLHVAARAVKTACAASGVNRTAIQPLLPTSARGSMATKLALKTTAAAQTIIYAKGEM